MDKFLPPLHQPGHQHRTVHSTSVAQDYVVTLHKEDILDVSTVATSESSIANSPVEEFKPHDIIHESQPHDAPPKMSRVRDISFIFTVCMAQLMTQAGLAEVMSSHQIIGSYFHIDNVGLLSWSLAAYSLTVGTFILVGGRLGDLFGYKRMYIIGFCWLALWSLIAGLSAWSNYILFLFARAFQGLGPTLLLPNSLALLGSTYAPGPKKNMCFAMFGATAPTGALIGLAFGAYFAQEVWWPWIFFSTAIASIALAILGLVVIPNPLSPSSSISTGGLKPLRHILLHDLDLPGAVTGITGLVLINISINQAPSSGWRTPYILTLLGLGLVFLAIFALIELRLAPSPLLPLPALRSSPVLLFVLAAIGLGWSCFGVWAYYFWQFLLNVRQITPLLASAQFTPVSPLGILASILTGFLLNPASRLHLSPAWILTLSLLSFLAGTVLIGTTPPAQTYWGQTFASLLITPFGMDMSFPAATVIVSDAMPRAKQGIAASLVTTVVNYGISVGLGIAASVQVAVVKKYQKHWPGEFEAGEREILLLKGYRAAFDVGMGLAGSGVVVCLLFVAWGHVQTRRNGQGRGYMSTPNTTAASTENAPGEISTLRPLSTATTAMDTTTTDLQQPGSPTRKSSPPIPPREPSGIVLLAPSMKNNKTVTASIPNAASPRSGSSSSSSKGKELSSPRPPRPPVAAVLAPDRVEDIELESYYHPHHYDCRHLDGDEEGVNMNTMNEAKWATRERCWV